MPIDRALATPLHIQVEEQLLDDIDAGLWGPGDRLPAESELAARFGVNRLTVREAISSLRRVGRVVARQGAGTFVSAPPLKIDVDGAGRPAPGSAPITDFTEEVLDVRRGTFMRDARAELRTDRGLMVETLARVAGAPVMLSSYAIATPMSADRAAAHLDGAWSAHAIAAVVGVALHPGWRAFDAVPAPRREAALLDIEVGAPLLRRSGVNLDAAEVPRTFHTRAYRSDRLRIVLRDGHA
ncbi:GntR family transcriptional regulator [Demequina gelatinilytica]|uniref:GntR family transcriptional regulator n=1 Tax=Demequina gelatinilytica TaxID=1638980 RepID=UPI0007846A93|nr:GntR family transcriptional regulator [Demequina gelatinilytica]